MKTFKALLLLCILSYSPAIFAQDDKPLMTDADWNALVPYMMHENWQEAEALTLTYLNKFKGEDAKSDEAGIVRYMYLAAVSGLVGHKNISKEAALKKLKGFEGKNIITPNVTFKQKGVFNYFTLSDDGKSWQKCFANNDSTVIFMFETFAMTDEATLKNAAQYEGRAIRVSAIIKSISAGGTTMPRLDLTYSDTEIWGLD